MNDIIVMATGRCNPPTCGHEKLIYRMKEYADVLKASHMFLTTHTHDKKNPLTLDTKLKHLQRAFPDINIQATTPTEGLLVQINLLRADRFRHLILVCGEDRLEWYHKVTEILRGSWETSVVMTAGSRNTKSSNLTDRISGTQMREWVKADNYNSFFLGLPTRLQTEVYARELYEDIKNEETTKVQVIPDWYKKLQTKGY